MTTDPEVSALLQQMRDHNEMMTQRSQDITRVFELLAEYLRAALAFHYGAPALPDGEWR